MFLKTKLIAMILCFWPLAALATENGDYVVLLHGIARSSAHMKTLEQHLAAQHYQVINLDYPSTKHPLSTLIDLTYKDIEKRVTDKSRKIHFVGYSMGSLLVRGILHKYRPAALGRVLLLAPPNQGSEVADFLKNNFFYKKFYGPAGQELITDQTHIKGLLGEVHYEVGILAGDRSIDPICYWIIPGKNDGKVAVERTKLKGMKDHLVVHASHSFFPSNQEVLMQTVHFLQHGQFKR